MPCMCPRMPFLILTSAISAAAVAVTAPAEAGKTFRGPVEAVVVDVIDGDTFLADAHIWPGHALRVNIRIRGIDAPEMKARCVVEREAALQARDVLASLVSQRTVSISNIAGAKYYGRVLADVATEDGSEIADMLLEQKLVRPYSGGKRRGWC